MKHNRQAQMKQLFLQKRRITTAELCEAFGVSVETVRRDLDALEQEGIIRRAYGAAMLAGSDGAPDMMPPWSSRVVNNKREKAAIAHAALAYIPDGATIVLDSGTAVLELAKLLYEKKNLTVLTNDMRACIEISSRSEHTLYYIGGVIKRGDMLTTGFLALDFLENFSHIDIAVISTDGFSVERGIMDHNTEMGILKKSMIERSEKVIAIMDHSKFSKQAFYSVCGVRGLDMVITSQKAPAPSVAALERAGVHTVCVEFDA